MVAFTDLAALGRPSEVVKNLTAPGRRHQGHPSVGGGLLIAGRASDHLAVQMWSEACCQWQAAVAPPASPLPTMPATVSSDDRPPKTLLAWTTLVDAYENKLLDGAKRQFPVKTLVGAAPGSTTSTL